MEQETSEQLSKFFQSCQRKGYKVDYDGDIKAFRIVNDLKQVVVLKLTINDSKVIPSDEGADIYSLETNVSISISSNHPLFIEELKPLLNDATGQNSIH